MVFLLKGGNISGRKPYSRSVSWQEGWGVSLQRVPGSVGPRVVSIGLETADRIKIYFISCGFIVTCLFDNRGVIY